MTQEQFAAHLGLDPRGMARWSTQPEMIPTMQTQQILDGALALADDGVKARFALLMAESGEAEKPVAQARPAEPIQESVSAFESPSVKRRLTPETLSYLKRHLQDQYAADNLLGPRVMLPGIIDHFNTIERLRQAASGQELDELLSLGAGYAEFAGWLSHDAGDLSGAAMWCGKALEMAEAAGDDVMAAFTIMRRAAAAISARDGGYAARLAKRAQRYDSPETIRVRAVAALTEAHGHAIDANPGETDRALDLAAGLVEQVDSAAAVGHDPTIVRYCAIPLYESISQAKCHLELGRATEAIDSFRVVLDTLPPDYHRDRGQYLARLTQSYVLGEQPEAACTAGEEALAIALETGSSRTISDLRRTIPDMASRWGKVPEFMRFRDLLATVERSNGGA
ncbi:MAG: hypothetical protein ACJ786_29270 [Catenulispora sp.]